MKRILITGGSGLVGRNLSSLLRKSGYHVCILTRNTQYNNEIDFSFWDIDNYYIDENVINNVDYIIHLAGESISNRWTEKSKQAMYNSRIKSAQLIFDKLDKKNNKLKAFISASAVGCYGFSFSDKVFDENDSFGNDFLAKLCKDWEGVANNFQELGIRTVRIRTGLVLDKYGGFLPKFSHFIKMGLGSALGSGKQFMPWIHIDDLCNIYIKSIEDSSMEGAYNAVAPNFISNEEFTRIVAKTYNKSIWLPNIPSFLLRLVFGEMSSILVNGNMISSEKIIKSGYKFNYCNLNDALKE